MKKIPAAAVLLIIISTCLISCQKEKLAPNPVTQQFNAVKFRQQIANFLTTGTAKARGYSIVVNKDGNWVDTFSFGWAYRNATGGSYASMHVNQEINIASVSKTITAVGALQLLKKNNLKIDSTIGRWLPSYWNAAPAIRSITFGELLTHSSGISQSATTYDSLKATVARGLDNPLKPFDVYANSNFALFRAMIPYLADRNAAIAKENAMLPNTAGFETWLSQEYVKYMQANIFTPIGITNASCTPSANTAMAFNENTGGPVDQVVAAVNGDWLNVCGGGGYYLSAMEVAKFQAYLAHTNILLDHTQRALMNSKLLGWDNEDSRMSDKGQAYGKDGALYWDLNNDNIPNTGDAGLQTFIMQFPNKIEVTIAVTSIPGAFRTFAGMVNNAYNISWENK